MNSLQQLSVHSFIVVVLWVYFITILGHDTEPEDLSIRAKVVDKINEIAELYGLGDESDTSQPVPECKLNIN